MTSRIIDGDIFVTYPYKKGSHNGIDLVKYVNGRTSLGTILAHSDGVVVAFDDTQRYNDSKNPSNYGNYVKIKHDNGMYTLYSHLSYGTVDAYVGKKVNKGEPIGFMGNTGYSFGAHLHFEVFDKDGNKINPTPYIDADLPDNEVKDSFIVYTVKKGDTLGKIAKNHNTTVAELVEYNNIANPNLIRVGQEIMIPIKEEEEDIELPFTPDQEETEAAEVTTYTVVEGDTLESVANAHGLTIEKLISLNVKLIKGDVLTIK